MEGGKVMKAKRRTAGCRVEEGRERTPRRGQCRGGGDFRLHVSPSLLKRKTASIMEGRKGRGERGTRRGEGFQKGLQVRTWSKPSGYYNECK